MVLLSSTAMYNNDWQFEKAISEMLIIVEGISTAFIVLFEKKAFSAIAVTMSPSGLREGIEM